MLDQGIDPRTHFKRELVLGSHEAVVRAVEVGTAAVGATFIDQEPSSNGKNSRPGWTTEVEVDDMRPLLISEPIPADTISVQGDLSTSLRDGLRSALLALHETDAGADVIYGLFGAERFEVGRAEEYEPIRRAIALSC